MDSARRVVDSHRLFYRWSQLEQDSQEDKLGSPSCPHPKPDRVIQLDEYAYYPEWPSALDECPVEAKRFSQVSNKYKTIDYNTFQKSGSLKLTEIELYFLSSFLTRASAHEWMVVYLGVGNGERFRNLRDQYFPSLAAIVYDPIDDFYTGNRQDVVERAHVWSNDGTNFEFRLRCFDTDKEVEHIQHARKDKKLLLISDIRGVAIKKMKYGEAFDRDADNELQWEAIQALRPVSSLLKFALPYQQFYYYPPGVILIQTFQYPDSHELRLRVDGVPLEKVRYNSWDIYEKHVFHNRHMRGLVYASKRDRPLPACMDCSFDCSVLWDTVSTYASRNDMDANAVLDSILKYHVYSLEDSDEDHACTAKKQTRRRRYVESSLRKGLLMDALAALEIVIEGDSDDFDWLLIGAAIEYDQPELASRLSSSLRKPASRADLLQLLGRLSSPLTLLRSDANRLSNWDWDQVQWMARTTQQDAVAWDTRDQQCSLPSQDEISWKRGKQIAEISTSTQDCTDRLDDKVAKKPKL